MAATGRLALVLLAAAACPFAAWPAAPAKPAEVDVFGYYILVPPMPAWAEQISEMHLATIAIRDGRVVPAPLWGLIRTKDSARDRDRPDYRIAAPWLTGRRLNFVTDAVDGVSFAFEGEFAHLGNFPVNPPQGVILSGRLIRLEHGRAAGELAARFRYEPGD